MTRGFIFLAGFEFEKGIACMLWISNMTEPGQDNFVWKSTPFFPSDGQRNFPEIPIQFVALHIFNQIEARTKSRTRAQSKGFLLY